MIDFSHFPEGFPKRGNANKYGAGIYTSGCYQMFFILPISPHEDTSKFGRGCNNWRCLEMYFYFTPQPCEYSVFVALCIGACRWATAAHGRVSSSTVPRAPVCQTPLPNKNPSFRGGGGGYCDSLPWLGGMGECYS